MMTLIGALAMVSVAHGLDAQGHRGARGLAPENTLASFARALAIGVNTVELDVGITRDGVAVVTHNPRLEPEITRDSEGLDRQRCRSNGNPDQYGCRWHYYRLP